MGAEQTLIALRLCETLRTLQWLYAALACISLLFCEAFALDQLLQYLPVKPLSPSALQSTLPGRRASPRGHTSGCGVGWE